MHLVRGYFFRQGRARGGLLALPMGMGVAGLVHEGPALLIPALFGLGSAIRQEPRHRLFFHLPVPDAVLLRRVEKVTLQCCVGRVLPFL